MTTTRRSLMLGLFGTLCAPAVAKAGVQVDGGHAFGSSWRITVGNAVPMYRLRPRIEAIIAEVDSQMSPYRRASDLSRFNRAGTLDWQPMPTALCHVTTEALRIAARTGGAFDPTVGPIVSRLGFGPIKGRAGHHSGLHAHATALRKDTPDLTLDLCGIAKGYSLDRIVGELTRAGVSDALVEVGGEVRATGTHPDGRNWRVAIADPRVRNGSALAIVAPGQLALATSGPAVNGLAGSISTSHIIDPAHGKAASSSLLSVSVLSPTAAEADALATALCALGPEAGAGLARRLDISALFLCNADCGRSEVTTGRFSQHLLI